jgi:hypothetical protein
MVLNPRIVTPEICQVFSLQIQPGTKKVIVTFPTKTPQSLEDPLQSEDTLVPVYRKTHTEVKGKGKVVPVLLLTEHHTMKAYWRSGGITPLIL